MNVYNDQMCVTVKDDRSPVTEADRRAEALILSELNRFAPDIPVVAEEEVAAGRVPKLARDTFILVDPLDGTKEFIGRRPDFTVNLALVESNVPIAGVVYAPAQRVMYSGSGGIAEKSTFGENTVLCTRKRISTRPRAEALVAVASRSHSSPETLAFLAEEGVTNYRSVGSSLKFCLVAEGEADVYPRFGRTMEWDTAAGDAVLRAAGGRTVTVDGAPLSYGKCNQASDDDFANPSFIGWGQA
ncbi:3'(2'), 5'-bisphosphate nucleotidase [Sinorhizobium terangae]|nr:3'(2'), 5'-bisphosphate nucleotidase [Sinorhizobium terangae]